MFEKGIFRMFIYLDVIRVSKKCSPYVFKMFRRPLWGQDFDQCLF